VATGAPTPPSTASPLTRARGDQGTREYLDRRTTEGRTRREAIRCIKRYIAREIYHLIRQLDLVDQATRIR
jgi:hypothetical protein